MQATLTFIIPVISKEITDRWNLVYANLKKTLASVENQTNSNWRMLLVS
jgi:glycosyltransferase involved in cell wall biosynthesis